MKDYVMFSMILFDYILMSFIVEINFMFKVSLSIDVTKPPINVDKSRQGG